MKEELDEFAKSFLLQDMVIRLEIAFLNTQQEKELKNVSRLHKRINNS